MRDNSVEAGDPRLETVEAASRKVTLREDRRLEVAALAPMDAEVTFSDIRLCRVDEPKSVIDPLLADNRASQVIVKTLQKSWPELPNA